MSNFDIESKHEEAMDIAETAFSLQRRGDEESAKKLFIQALEIERVCAMHYAPSLKYEPSRSILCRSAASLAFNAGDFEEAERLVCNGLAGYPPPEIKEELHILRDKVKLRNYNITNKYASEITEQEIQLTLSGNAIGYGLISPKLLLKRIEKFEALFYRTFERMANRPYRESGKPDKEITSQCGLYLNAFYPGSFGVSFSLGEPSPQLKLFSPDKFQVVSSSGVIQEVITCFDLVQQNNFEELYQKFNEDNYLSNFLGLAKQIAPDGDAIQNLGLSTQINGESLAINFSKNKHEIQSAWTNTQLDVAQTFSSQKETENFEFTGQLKIADNSAKGEWGKVKILLDDDSKRTILVPRAQMQDVVKPYYDEWVVISGIKKSRNYYLIDIDAFDS